MHLKGFIYGICDIKKIQMYHVFLLFEKCTYALTMLFNFDNVFQIAFVPKFKTLDIYSQSHWSDSSEAIYLEKSNSVLIIFRNLCQKRNEVKYYLFIFKSFPLQL